MEKIKDEDRKKLIEDIIYYFKTEREIELGLISAEKILIFFEEVLGNKIYNLALDDAKKFYLRYAEDMGSDYYSLYK